MTWHPFYRRPRTTQERRATCVKEFLLLDGYRVKIRASRNRTNLVDAWDDQIRCDIQYKSWKDITRRRHQYKNE